MTIEEIRKHKEQAEQDIGRRLQEFKELTGMSPVALSLTVYEYTDFSLRLPGFFAGAVTIELERI